MPNVAASWRLDVKKLMPLAVDLAFEDVNMLMPLAVSLARELSQDVLPCASLRMDAPSASVSMDVASSTALARHFAMWGYTAAQQGSNVGKERSNT